MSKNVTLIFVQAGIPIVIGSNHSHTVITYDFDVAENGDFPLSIENHGDNIWPDEAVQMMLEDMLDAQKYYESFKDDHMVEKTVEMKQELLSLLRKE